MGGLAWARNRKDHEATAAADAADQAVYAYSPRLIQELCDEHRTLLKRHGEIEKMVLAGSFGSISHGLAGFKAKFNVHNLRENLHCYGYVRRTLARRPLELAAVTKLQQRADAIGRQLLDFVDKYRSGGVSRANAQEFLTGLRAIGALLTERNRREEAELFVLYRP